MQAVQTQLRQALADAELQRQELEAARQDLAALKNRGGSQNELAMLWQRLDAKGQEVSAVKNSHQQQLQVWGAARFSEALVTKCLQVIWHSWCGRYGMRIQAVMALQQLLRSQYLLLAVTSDLCQPGHTKSHTGHQGALPPYAGGRDPAAQAAAAAVCH